MLRTFQFLILGRKKMTLRFFETFCEEPKPSHTKSSSLGPVQLVQRHEIPPQIQPPQNAPPYRKKKKKKKQTGKPRLNLTRSLQQGNSR